MNFIILLKKHQRAAATLCVASSVAVAATAEAVAAAPPPNLMVASAVVVASNVSCVITAPNSDPALLSPDHVLLASRDCDSGGFGSEGRPLLSTIAGGRLTPSPPSFAVVFGSRTSS